MNLSTAAIIEKNRVSTDGVYLLLLTIQYKNEEAIHLVLNNEKITFKGVDYYPYYFSLSEVKQTSTELPSCTLTVSNITGTISRILETYDGASGGKVTVAVINTNISDEILQEEHFVIAGATTKKDYVSIKLGCGASLDRRYPNVRIMKDWCPFKFKGVRCGYKGSLTTCNKTLTDCRERGNNTRFGGEPTIPQGGLYARRN